MFAAKGGNKPDDFIYSGSNNLDEVGWYSENCNSIQKVGQEKAPNKLGIYDMSGNVFELTMNIKPEIYFKRYGGCFSFPEKECKLSFEPESYPSLDYFHFIGFRLICREIKKQDAIPLRSHFMNE